MTAAVLARTRQLTRKGVQIDRRVQGQHCGETAVGLRGCIPERVQRPRYGRPVSEEETGLGRAVAAFGQRAKTKLSATITGEPEDQLRNPTELLLADVAAFAAWTRGS
jgi:hypothetical protein